MKSTKCAKNCSENTLKSEVHGPGKHPEIRGISRVFYVQVCLKELHEN